MPKEKFKTSIGGQALIEGVMMKGPDKTAMAIRLPDGTIDTEAWEEKSKKWYHKTPFLRGSIVFVSSMISGYKCLMKSAEKAGFDEVEEPSAFEKKLEEKLGDKFMAVIMGIAGVLAVGIAVSLFMVLPSYIVKWVEYLVNLGLFRTLFEGLIRIAILVAYMALTSKMKDIRRVYEYHGAEHKTISCYEAGGELTPESAKAYTRFHPRCGTSFILISLVVSIIVSSFISWDVVWLRVVIKLLLLPVTIGIAYELIRLAGRYNNIVTRIISAPGMWLQRITTKEPDASQLEVAITSFMAAKPSMEGSDQY